MGEETEVALFAEKFYEIIEYYRKYHRLDQQDIEKYFFDKEHLKSASNGDFEQVIVFGTSGKPIRARTINQLQLVNDYRTNDLVIAEGPAGTGKTYTAIALAVKALKEREVKKIILTRPAVEAGERLGFLPGDVRENLILIFSHSLMHFMICFHLKSLKPGSKMRLCRSRHLLLCGEEPLKMLL